MTIASINNYIICLYYLCKVKFHDRYLHVCNVVDLQEKIYEQGKCNCLTEQNCQAICDYIVNPRNSVDSICITNECKPVEKCSDSFFYHYESVFVTDNSISNMPSQNEIAISHEELADIRIIIDICICCAALSNCQFPQKSMREFVKMIYTVAGYYEDSLDPKNKILASNDINTEYMICIIDSFELLKQLANESKIYSQNYSIFDMLKNCKENIDRVFNSNYEDLLKKEGDDLADINDSLLNRQKA